MKFTKTETEILQDKGFTFSGDTLKHPEGHNIEKDSKDEYTVYFKYPKGSTYKGLSMPKVDFGKLLDTISKFDRYFKTESNYESRTFSKTTKGSSNSSVKG